MHFAVDHSSLAWSAECNLRGLLRSQERLTRWPHPMRFDYKSTPNKLWSMRRVLLHHAQHQRREFHHFSEFQRNPLPTCAEIPERLQSRTAIESLQTEPTRWFLRL